ncbi:hypothetical protein BLNAU_6796 [Blattamonas nauphoetae]|uniref:Uncharacterized protein n=1 Tax=Blattamonas nauphoetae TaxID=2049346 RepID=A0ABQ9Y3M1_9EUKA|nr:hypothetical protein BLNAU_6796 [Blattamonas nauphoetae]
MSISLLHVILASLSCTGEEYLKLFNTKGLVKPEDKPYEVVRQSFTYLYNFRKPLLSSLCTSGYDTNCIALLRSSQGTCSCMGVLDNEDISLLPDDKGFKIRYTNPLQGYSTDVTVTCAKTHVFTVVDTGNSLNITIEDKAGCRGGGGIGWGWIFLIALLASIVLFLAIGIPINAIARKKKGVEIIPLFALWVSLPRLVLEGVKCLFSPCKKKRQGFSDIE